MLCLFPFLLNCNVMYKRDQIQNDIYVIADKCLSFRTYNTQLGGRLCVHIKSVMSITYKAHLSLSSICCQRYLASELNVYCGNQHTNTIVC